MELGKKQEAWVLISHKLRFNSLALSDVDVGKRLPDRLALSFSIKLHRVETA